MKLLFYSVQCLCLSIFQDRAKSGLHDDDIYFYGGMEIQSQSTIDRQYISLDSEISRGRFAIIYKALYFGKGTDAETVVAKTLKGIYNLYNN